MTKLYRPTALLALTLFLVLAVLHVAAMLRFIAPSIGVAALAFPLVLAGQVVTIAGFNGGTFRQGGSLLTMKQRFRAPLVALRHIPMGWRLFGIPFWYAYVPATFFTRLLGAEGQVRESGGTLLLTYKGQYVRAITQEEAFRIHADQFVAFSVIVAAFAFAQFICLRFVIPKRAEILSELGVRAA